jgi:hypothetical protein
MRRTASEASPQPLASHIARVASEAHPPPRQLRAGAFEWQTCVAAHCFGSIHRHSRRRHARRGGTGGSLNATAPSSAQCCFGSIPTAAGIARVASEAHPSPRQLRAGAFDGTPVLRRTASEASPQPLTPRRGGTGGSLNAAAPSSAQCQPLIAMHRDRRTAAASAASDDALLLLPDAAASCNELQTRARCFLQPPCV